MSDNMNDTIFRTKLAKLFEVDVELIGLDYPLKDNIAWDSLTLLSTIALVDQLYGVTLNLSSIFDCTNIAALLELIHHHLETA